MCRMANEQFHRRSINFWPLTGDRIDRDPDADANGSIQHFLSRIRFLQGEPQNQPRAGQNIVKSDIAAKKARALGHAGDAPGLMI